MNKDKNEIFIPNIESRPRHKTGIVAIYEEVLDR